MKKLAIVVGHNSLKQGAVRRDTGETEWLFNSRIAKRIMEYSRTFPGVEVDIFFRNAGAGYTREIREVYRKVDAWGADASIELHFNSFKDPSATGTETLISGSAASLKLGEAVNLRMVSALGLKDRGLITRRTGRGSESLMAGRAPAILVEPFFGSSAKGLAATDTEEEEFALAKAIMDGAAAAFGIMPRQSLDDSRTMVATGVQKTISNAQTGTGVGTAVSAAINGVRADIEAIPAVGPLADWLPWITVGLGLATVGLAIWNRVQAKTIEAARIDDLEREIR